MYTVLLYVLRYIAGKQGEERAQRLFEAWVDQLRQFEHGKRQRLIGRMELSLRAAETGGLGQRYFVNSISEVDEALREVEAADHDELVSFWWLRRIGVKSADRCNNSIREMTQACGIDLVLEVANFCSQELGRAKHRDLPVLSPESVIAQARRLANRLEAGEFGRANRLLWDHDQAWRLCAPALKSHRPPYHWSYHGYGGQLALATA